MIMIVCIYDDGITCNMACKNSNCIIDKYKFPNESLEIDIKHNMIHEICIKHNIQFHGNKNMKNMTNTDVIISEMNICRKVSVMTNCSLMIAKYYTRRLCDDDNGLPQCIFIQKNLFCGMLYHSTMLVQH